MSPTNIILGIMVVALGICAIAYNKYPGKEISYENARKRCSTVNERRVTLFDGIFCIIFGVAYASLGMIFLAILIIGYYPVRTIFLKLRFI
ncbi:hypothetical protein [Clostridium sp.]|uniref:hypothetical protein n=1 Tax=Clostridium sp. TaxID=1506 RepID=UPI003D6CFD9B